MSKSLNNFNLAIKDAEVLIGCYDSMNESDKNLAPEVLKRATLIMILTAWETYVEDIATELFKVKFGALKGCHVGNYIEEQFSIRLKTFHNPDSVKTKRIFKEFFGIDVTEKWSWNNFYPDQVKKTLNMWIKRRGEAVHRAQIDLTKAHIVKRDELEKCLKFFSDLATNTDIALLEI